MQEEKEEIDALPIDFEGKVLKIKKDVDDLHEFVFGKQDRGLEYDLRLYFDEDYRLNCLMHYGNISFVGETDSFGLTAQDIINLTGGKKNG